MKDINKTLLKKAMGYVVEETTTEYLVDEEGRQKPTKIKTQSKYIPPDLSALKTYLEMNNAQSEFEQMTDEQLEAERQRLIKLVLPHQEENPAKAGKKSKS